MGKQIVVFENKVKKTNGKKIILFDKKNKYTGDGYYLVEEMKELDRCKIALNPIKIEPLSLNKEDIINHLCKLDCDNFRYNFSKNGIPVRTVVLGSKTIGFNFVRGRFNEDVDCYIFVFKIKDEFMYYMHQFEHPSTIWYKPITIGENKTSFNTIDVEKEFLMGTFTIGKIKDYNNETSEEQVIEEYTNAIKKHHKEFSEVIFKKTGFYKWEVKNCQNINELVKIIHSSMLMASTLNFSILRNGETAHCYNLASLEINDNMIFFNFNLEYNKFVHNIL
jgi:hypothetical protein